MDGLYPGEGGRGLLNFYQLKNLQCPHYTYARITGAISHTTAIPAVQKSRLLLMQEQATFKK